MDEFEPILRDPFMLTTFCQKEEKLNGTYGIVARRSLHDSLSSGTMHVIN